MRNTVRRTVVASVATAAVLVPAAPAQAAPLRPLPPTHDTDVPVDAPYVTCPEAMRVVGELDRTVHQFVDADGDVVREFRNVRFEGRLVGANGMSLPYVGNWRVVLTYDTDGELTGSTFQGLSRKVTLQDGSHVLAAGRVDRDATGTPFRQSGSNTLTEWETTFCEMLRA